MFQKLSKQPFVSFPYVILEFWIEWENIMISSPNLAILIGGKKIIQELLTQIVLHGNVVKCECVQKLHSQISYCVKEKPQMNCIIENSQIFNSWRRI